MANNTFQNDILKLILTGTAINNFAENNSINPQTKLYIALHYADPYFGNNQTTYEINYNGYNRKEINRSFQDWIITDNEALLINNIIFNQSLESSKFVTHFSIGTTNDSSSQILYSGQIFPTIKIESGTIPIIKSGTKITVNSFTKSTRSYKKEEPNYTCLITGASYTFINPHVKHPRIGQYLGQFIGNNSLVTIGKAGDTIPILDANIRSIIDNYANPNWTPPNFFVAEYCGSILFEFQTFVNKMVKLIQDFESRCPDTTILVAQTPPVSMVTGNGLIHYFFDRYPVYEETREFYRSEILSKTNAILVHSNEHMRTDDILETWETGAPFEINKDYHITDYAAMMAAQFYASVMNSIWACKSKNKISCSPKCAEILSKREWIN